MLISKIGESIYSAAVAELGKISDNTADINQNFEIPDVADVMAELEFTDSEEWEVWNELIIQLPCYKIWMCVYMHYTHRLDNFERIAFLKKIATLLDDTTDAVSAALQHALQVDFFEGDDVFEGISGPELTWREIQVNVHTRKGKQRLLKACTPIPFELKEPFLQELITDKATHKAVLKELYQSLSNPWCKANKSIVSRLLKQLEVDTSDSLYKEIVAAI